MHACPKQTQVARHGEEEQRDGEDQADDQQAALGIDLDLAGLRFGIFARPRRFRRLQTRRRDRPAQISLADHGGDVAHAGAFGGETHLGGEHALPARPGLFPAGGRRCRRSCGGSAGRLRRWRPHNRRVPPARSGRAARPRLGLTPPWRVRRRGSPPRVCTPFTFFRLRSTVATQLAQVIPVIGKVSCLLAGIRPPIAFNNRPAPGISPRIAGLLIPVNDPRR